MADPRPDVEVLTEVVYRGLPEVYRDADAAQDTGPSNYPLLRFLSLLLDQLTPLVTLVNRLNYVAPDERFDQPTGPGYDAPGDYGTSLFGEPGSDLLGVPGPWWKYGSGTYGLESYGDRDTSDLVDPSHADIAWLPWLAQLTGVTVAGLTPTQARTRMFDPSASWGHGTRPTIKRLALETLGNPTAYVGVRDNHDGPFTIGIVTRAADTVTVTVEELLAALEAERPAGYLFAHVYLEDLAS